MKMIALIIMVAVLLEGLVEYAKTVMKMVEDQEYKTAITQGITVMVGVLFAFIFHLHLFNSALTEVYEGLLINPVIDQILTGIIISRGSNYASDFISKLTKKNDNTFVIEDDTDEFEEEGDMEVEDDE